MKNKIAEMILLLVNLIMILTNINYYNSLQENILNEPIKDAIFVSTALLISFSLMLSFKLFIGEDE
jgi:hypothetical protein